MSERQRIGIDVSKRERVWSWVDGTAERVVRRGQVANTPCGWRALLAAVPPTAAWVVEPTGRYGEGLVAAGQAAGRVVLAASPRKARAFARSQTSRAKTDRVDSEALGWSGLSRTLPVYRLQSEAVNQVEQLLAARRGVAQALSRLRQQAGELPLAAGALAPAIGALAAELVDLDRQVAAAVAAAGELAVARELLKVEGIGPVTAAAVTARLAAGGFASADAFVAYCGLDLAVADSGERQGRRRLSKEGSGELRRLLYLCAQASLRAKDSPFAQQYERELAKGLATTAALCAVARKLAKVCWSLWRHGTPYDRTRVYQQPTRAVAQVTPAAPTAGLIP